MFTLILRFPYLVSLWLFSCVLLCETQRDDTGTLAVGRGEEQSKADVRYCRSKHDIHFHWVHTQKWIFCTYCKHNHSFLHRSSLVLFCNSCRRRLGQCVCQWAKMNNKINSIISIMLSFLAIITIIRFSTSLKVRLTLREKKHSWQHRLLNT